MPLADTDIADLVTGTLQELGRMKFNQIATDLQNYEVMGRIMKKQKVQFDSGIGIRRTILVEKGSSARNVGLYETDQVDVEDGLQTISVDWRHTTCNWAYERREMLMNKGPEKIVDLIKVRRAMSMIDLADHMETSWWSAPTSSSDKTEIWGIPYWIVQSDSEGFNGGNNSVYTDGPGGLSASTYSGWKNYTAEYASVSKDDLIRKMRKAVRQTNFKSPVDIPDYRKGRGQQFRIYVTDTTIGLLEELGEAQNENLGRDLASMDGSITFRRNPIVWVPYLDTAVSPSDGSTVNDPIYMINYAWFCPVFLRGDYLRESSPRPAPNQHNVFHVHVDLTWNVLCTCRREQAVLTTGA